MNRTCQPAIPSVTWGGFQIRARQVFQIHGDVDLMPTSTVFNTCNEGQYFCFEPGHMRATYPVKVAYAPGVCVYCGDPAGTRDHLIPRAGADFQRRTLVATVPACGSCNSILGAFHEYNVTRRRQRVHERLATRHKKVIEAPRWLDGDYEEMGYILRNAVEAMQNKRDYILARMDWPGDDLFYDIAAFQRSGIEDPVVLGLADNPWDPDAERLTGRWDF